MPGSNQYSTFMRAAAAGDAEALEALIPQTKAEGTLNDNLLRLALQRACKTGKAATAQILLREGAPTDLTGSKGSPALFWAVNQPQTKDHHEVIELLLSHKFPHTPADKEWRDENGRTIFMAAAWRGHNEALRMLISDGADVNARDKDGRTVLHNLACDSKCRWNKETVQIILDRDISIDVRDYSRARTALHWAVATGKQDLVEQLVTRKFYQPPNINARSTRDKTALHLACRAEPPSPAIVKTLLQHGARPDLVSDGQWTCLHTAAKRKGNEAVVELLLRHDSCLINKTTSTGMTSLHVAAQYGCVNAVRRLLQCEDVKLNAKDSFYMTPMLRAAQERHTEIVELLSPFSDLNVSKISDLARYACESFQATVVDFKTNKDDPPLVFKHSVSELLYEREKNGTPKVTTNVHETKYKAKAKPRFRWIHLPANNMAWAEALIAKAFVESGGNDVRGLKAAERALSEQHRGEQYHSSFMRPLCQRAERGKGEDNGTRSSSNQPGARMSINESRALQESSPERTSARDRRRRRGEFASVPTFAAQEPLPRINGSPAVTPSARPEGDGPELDARRSGSDAPTDQRVDGLRDTPPPNQSPGSPGSSARRNRRQRRTPSGPGIENQPPVAPDELGPLRPTRTQSFPLSELSVRTNESRTGERSLLGSNIFLFMPYLHFETDKARREMSAAVRSTVPKGSDEIKRPRKRAPSRPPNRWSQDEMLIHAYLHSTTGLHLRRTLDQFYLHGIDTAERDEDQVVGRYCQSRGKECKVFMVDQLWMWVLGPSLIITAFPNRWNSPRNDPLNVLDGIIEDMNAKTGRPVETVHDLALLITARCAGSFDRHKPGDDEFQFFDMFESSIGTVNSRETELYNKFYDASRKVHDWLRDNERLSISINNRYPRVVDRFLDIGDETRLLKEIKDIQDELNMIGMVLNQQRSLLEPLCNNICEDLGHLGRPGGPRNKAREEVRRRVDDQKWLVDRDISELDRMGRLAHGIEQSLINLLDLKQKQSNAFEARFARDQAAGTVRQGQTILIFTVVTIFFLPVSFMAQFFTINISSFHRDGSNNLPLNYVAQYIFGIGLGMSVLIILVAFMFNPLGSSLRDFKLVDVFSGEAPKRRQSEETLATTTGRRLSLGGGEAPVRMSRYSKEEKRSMVGSEFSSLAEPRTLNVPQMMSTSPVSFRLRGPASRDLENG